MLRNIARRPLNEKIIYLKFGFVITIHENHLCPRCKSILNAGPNYQPKHCEQCGQKINFKGAKWKDDVMIGYAGRSKVYESV